MSVIHIVFFNELYEKRDENDVIT